MDIYSIICEYNPFHNGHLYQLEKCRENGATHIVGIMSGNFVQRGELSVIDKHKRAEIAVRSGIDLIIELPVPYSIASAELFAKGAVYILNSLGVVDKISFGSECGDIKLLVKAAAASTSVSDSEEVRKLISEGFSYPSAVSTVIKKSYSKDIAEIFSSPNNTLAIEYIEALDFYRSQITPVTIKRTMVHHDSNDFNDNFASASLVREMLVKGISVEKFVPSECYEIIGKEITNGNSPMMQNLQSVIFYKLLTLSKNDMSEIPDANNGLSDRLFSACRRARNLDELLLMTKTKCFTLARIRRVISYALLGVRNEDFKIAPPYARILAFNERGREILTKAKKTSTIPFSTSLLELSKASENAQRFAKLEINASNIFSLGINNFNGIYNEFTKNVSIIK